MRWENLGLTSFEQISRSVGGNIVSILLMMITFVSLVLLKYWQNYVKDKYGHVARIAVSLIITALINVLNVFISMAVRTISTLQRPTTHTRWNVNTSQRVALVPSI